VKEEEEWGSFQLNFCTFFVLHSVIFHSLNLRLYVVHPGRAWPSSPACTRHSLRYLFLDATPLFTRGVTLLTSSKSRSNWNGWTTFHRTRGAAWKTNPNSADRVDTEKRGCSPRSSSPIRTHCVARRQTEALLLLRHDTIRVTSYRTSNLRQGRSEHCRLQWTNCSHVAGKR